MKDHETEFGDHWSPLFGGVQMYSALYQRISVTPEQLAEWMSHVNTQMLELILTVADKPEWYTQQVMAEIQRRRRKAVGGTMKTTELIELLETQDVTKDQLYNLLIEDLEIVTQQTSGSIADPMPQEIVRFFRYQIEDVVFPVIRDLRVVLSQVQRGGEVFKEELDEQDQVQ